jgi:hypothetical protein
VLDGRIALVTGAGSGVGRGIALALARAGASIAGVGRRVELLEETVALVEAEGGTAAAFPADVSVRAEVTACVDAAAARFGGIDLLVNAARRAGTVPQLTDDDFRTDWWSGFGGALHCMQACHPHLRPARRGREHLGGRRSARHRRSPHASTNEDPRHLALRQPMGRRPDPVNVVVRALPALRPVGDRPAEAYRLTWIHPARSGGAPTATSVTSSCSSAVMTPR